MKTITDYLIGFSPLILFLPIFFIYVLRKSNSWKEVWDECILMIKCIIIAAIAVGIIRILRQVSNG